MSSATDAVVVRRAPFVAVIALAVIAGVAIGAGGSRLGNQEALAMQRAPADSPWVFSADTACTRLVNEVTRQRKPPGEGRRNPESQWSRAQRCAMEQDNRLRMQMVGLAAATSMQLAMVHAMIPEYHDEQRLKGWNDPNDRRLGPAAGIFLTPFIPDISNRKVIPSHRDKPGMLVGYVVVIKQQGETLPPNYQALHLDWGMNCVWLKNIAGNNYEAYISQPLPDSACRSNPMPTLHGPLE